MDQKEVCFICARQRINVVLSQQEIRTALVEVGCYHRTQTGISSNVRAVLTNRTRIS